jgi:hypothetical protein
MSCQEIAEILDNFSYTHLPPHLAEVSRPFCEIAHDPARRSEAERWRASETLVALRKLLEGKDCAVRALNFRAREEDADGAN